MRGDAKTSGGERRFVVTGCVVELETGRPLRDLVVCAFDQDPISDDALGVATTDEDGRFAIRFTEARFRELFETRPDLFLRVYDRSGARVLHDGAPLVRRGAGLREDFLVRVPARALRASS